MENPPTAQTSPMMTFPDAVKTCIRKYGDFSDRATRAEFWWWTLFTVVGGIVFGVIDSIIGIFWDYGPLETLFHLAVLLPGIAVTARRLHDIGRTGWWQLAWLVIPFTAWVASGIMFIVGLFIAFGKANPSGGWSFDDDDIVWENAGQALAFLPAAIMLLAAVAITLAVIVWAIVWMVRQGEPGPNRHGPDPRASDPAAPEELP